MPSKKEDQDEKGGEKEKKSRDKIQAVPTQKGSLYVTLIDDGSVNVKMSGNLTIGEVQGMLNAAGRQIAGVQISQADSEK